jgi:ABC-type sugar transport system ATPase subunit
MVDARLKDGSRVNAIIPPLSLDGPVLSIRRFGAEPLRMNRLIDNQALTPDMASMFEMFVQARLSILIPGGTGACLINSFNFDFARLRRFVREDCRLVHRVDGPIGAYRGFDDGTDLRIARINHEVADATIFQSRFSLDKHGELGYELRDPVVIPNAVDPAIFHRPEEREPLEGRRVRVVASSWSVNPRKGAETFAWLAEALDLDAFVGRGVTDTSLGEQQRVAVARALVLSPRLAVLDEPTGHQDDDHVTQVVAALASAARAGTAILVATHDARVWEVADRVVRLDEGRIAPDPAPDPV